MFSTDALADLHERTHRSFRGFIEHCRALSPEELDREIPGFGYASVRLQVHHVIGAEEYWIGVLRGAFRAEDDQADFPDLPSLEAYRERIAAATRATLRDATPEELNTPRPMLTWGGKERTLVPAHVVLRTQTHAFHHMGQISAMARILGKPVAPGLDFPLV